MTENSTRQAGLGEEGATAVRRDVVGEDPAVAAAQREVARRRGGEPAGLAEALEGLATASIEVGEAGVAASALEEAAGLWNSLGDGGRLGHCLLLAATMQRLRGDLRAARLDLERAAGAELPDAVRSAFEAEAAEQALAHGQIDEAIEKFSSVIEVLGDELARAQLLQRRAAASFAGERWHDAATDLLDAEAMYSTHGDLPEAEAAALGAAYAYAHVEPGTAEQVWRTATSTSPRDGANAAQRNITGGRIALLAGNPTLALNRYDEARQGALDAVDPFAYLTAASEAAEAAQALGDDTTAYARLATAWTTLTDLLGPAEARQLIRPLLEQLHTRLGPTRFTTAKTTYESHQHPTTS